MLSASNCFTLPFTARNRVTLYNGVIMAHTDYSLLSLSLFPLPILPPFFFLYSLPQIFLSSFYIVLPTLVQVSHSPCFSLLSPPPPWKENQNDFPHHQQFKKFYAFYKLNYQFSKIYDYKMISLFRLFYNAKLAVIKIIYANSLRI